MKQLLIAMEEDSCVEGEGFLIPQRISPKHPQIATQLHATWYVHSPKDDWYQMLLISLLLTKPLVIPHPFSGSKTEPSKPALCLECKRLKSQGLAIKRQIFKMNKRNFQKGWAQGLCNDNGETSVQVYNLFQDCDLKRLKWEHAKDDQSCLASYTAWTHVWKLLVPTSAFNRNLSLARDLGKLQH